MWTVISRAGERSTLHMPSSRLRRLAASSNRAAAASQGLFSFSYEMDTGAAYVATRCSPECICYQAARGGGLFLKFRSECAVEKSFHAVSCAVGARPATEERGSDRGSADGCGSVWNEAQDSEVVIELSDCGVGRSLAGLWARATWSAWSSLRARW